MLNTSIYTRSVIVEKYWSGAIYYRHKYNKLANLQKSWQNTNLSRWFFFTNLLKMAVSGEVQKKCVYIKIFQLNIWMAIT